MAAKTYHQSTTNSKLTKDGSYNEQNLHLMQDIDPITNNARKQKAISSAGGTQPNTIYSSSILRKKRETANIIIGSIANSKTNLKNINENEQKTINPNHMHHQYRIKYDAKIPNFNNIKSENAVKYCWNYEQKRWIKSAVRIKIAPNPFENGSLRIAYYCILISDSQSVPNYEDVGNTKSDGNRKSTFRHQSCDISVKDDKVMSSLFGYEDIFGGQLCVLKKGNSLIDSQQNSLNIYFNDVRTQIESKQFADEYNKYNPPKKITFLYCSVIQLIDRKPTQNDFEIYATDQINKVGIHQFYCLEPYLFGRYTKHSNNVGWDENKRNTPAAFTHFTLLASNNRLCVCDIQGVNDL